jgi:glycosyltransferase involved in cell wall biosynthesis
MKVNIISINPTTSIPLFRFIIDFFINSMNVKVELTEVYVKKLSNYYKKINSLQFNNIATYNSYEEFMKQSSISKFYKYFKVFFKSISILKSREKQLIYTCDYQVLFFVLIVKKIYKKRNHKIIYHQFELIEEQRLNKINQIFFSYILKKAHLIDLTIFPEINRLHYFLDNSTLKKSKAFIFPNTCETILQKSEIKKHELFNQLPENSFIVGHLGNVGGSQHYFQNFIDAIKILEPNSNIVFLFLGRKNKMIETVIKNNQLSNLFFVDSIPHEKLSEIYPFINLGVILYKGTGLNYEFCAPNKLYELWANGIPVIGHKLKGLVPLFDCEEKGVLTNFDNVNEIAERINLFANEKHDYNLLKNIFNEKLAINNYLNLFQQRIEQFYI